jgi:DNA invertase Pin-like site-specific DNA recombinase
MPRPLRSSELPRGRSGPPSALIVTGLAAVSNILSRRSTTKREIGFKVLTGAAIGTTTPQGRLLFGIFASLAEFKRELIRERVMAGLTAARARGRKGGRRPVFTPSKLRRAQAAMTSRDTHVSYLCKELGISRATLYNHVTPDGKLTTKGAALLEAR